MKVCQKQLINLFQNDIIHLFFDNFVQTDEKWVSAPGAFYVILIVRCSFIKIKTPFKYQDQNIYVLHIIAQKFKQSKLCLRFGTQ